MNPRRLTFAFYCAAATALVIAAYANSLHNSFHFDDSHVIETNLYLRNLANVPRFFTDAHTFSSLPQNATYRPLVTLSLAIDYARGHGLDPLAFHTTQIALLLITGALLVLFFTPLTGQWLALFAATLFCVHTANTETMNLISARSELLSTIGLLLSFILYQRSPFWRRTLLYLLPLAIGALAKAPLVVFAPLLFAYAMLFEGQTWRRALRTMMPSLLLGIALLVFLNAMNAPEWTSGGSARWPYLITQPFVWLHYFRLFFLPLGLTADTDWGTFAQWYDTRAVAGYTFIALLIWWIRRSARDERLKSVAFGLIWFAVALIPTSSFPLAEVTNEHRVFFAFIGLVLALTTSVSAWIVAAGGQDARRRKGAVVCAVALLLAHAIGTHERNEVWSNEETLWADVVVKSPMNGRAWMNFGLTQMARGRYAEAKAAFDRAAVYTPRYSYLEINQGIVEGELGHPAEAERHFRNALAMNPDANAHFFFARWLVGVGRAPEALVHLKTSLSQSSAAPAPRDLLLRLDDARGAEAETRALLEETRKLDPNEPSIADVTRTWPSYTAAFTDGLSAIQHHDWPAAAHASRDALRHDPQSADAYNNLAWALAQLGFRTEAVQAYRMALTLNPNHERARNNLQLALAAK
ncbi:MAG: tetratricopeptide repeat protein [Thermoanaerobaculia bacterium]